MSGPSVARSSSPSSNSSVRSKSQEKVMSSLDSLLSRRKTTPPRPQTTVSASPATARGPGTSALPPGMNRRLNNSSGGTTGSGSRAQGGSSLTRSPSSGGTTYHHRSAESLLQRSTWTETGQQDDPVSQPTMKRIGLKLKQRYLVPNDLDSTFAYSGFATVCHKPLLGDAPASKWKRRYIVVKDNKVYFMRKPRETVAVFFITLDDCVIDPQEFPSQPYSFRLLPPPGCVKETSQEMMWIVVADSEDQKLDFMEAFLKAAGWRERQLAASGSVPRITLIPAPDPETEALERRNSTSAGNSDQPLPSPDSADATAIPMNGGIGDTMYFSSDESDHGRSSHDEDAVGGRGSPPTPPTTPPLWTANAGEDGAGFPITGSAAEGKPLARSTSSGSTSSTRSVSNGMSSSYTAAAAPRVNPLTQPTRASSSPNFPSFSYGTSSSNAAAAAAYFAAHTKVPPIATNSLPRPLRKASTSSTSSSGGSTSSSVPTGGHVAAGAAALHIRRSPSPAPASPSTPQSDAVVHLYPIPPPPPDLRHSEQALLEALIAPNARFFRKGPSVTLNRKAGTTKSRAQRVADEGMPKRRSTEPIRRSVSAAETRGDLVLTAKAKAPMPGEHPDALPMQVAGEVAGAAGLVGSPRPIPSSPLAGESFGDRAGDDDGEDVDDEDAFIEDGDGDIEADDDFSDIVIEDDDEGAVTPTSELMEAVLAASAAAGGSSIGGGIVIGGLAGQGLAADPDEDGVVFVLEEEHSDDGGADLGEAVARSSADIGGDGRPSLVRRGGVRKAGGAGGPLKSVRDKLAGPVRRSSMPL
ncbi:hypothetical protein HDU96_009423 [Phlyctochytrium bullatum]|nr:hypothetical protein HDU96_009423 [Phlyctochytrium bullatum]